MTNKIKRAKYKDCKEILKIYSISKDYMRANGNNSQWSHNYPNKKIIKEDIQNKNLYKVLNYGKIIACFALISGTEETYAKIENGAWKYSENYATIHRLASNCEGHGIANIIFSFCQNKFPYLRVDTHPDNRSMLKAIEKFGFEYAGIIHVRDGSMRLAFEKIMK